MECAVYDTYVTKKDGRIMHFDVIVEASTPHEKAIEYATRAKSSLDVFPHSRERDALKALLAHDDASR